MRPQPPHPTYSPFVGLLSQQSKRGFLCSGCIAATRDEVLGERRTPTVQIPEGFFEAVRTYHDQKPESRRQRHGIAVLAANDSTACSQHAVRLENHVCRFLRRFKGFNR